MSLSDIQSSHDSDQSAHRHGRAKEGNTDVRMRAQRGKSKRGESGATLLEVLVAVMILGLCASGLFSIVTLGWRMSNQAHSHYAAINVAKNRIEKAIGTDFILLDTFAEDSILVDEAGLTNAAGKLRRTTTILTNISPRMAEITVRVDIRNPRSGVFSGENESLTTRVADFQELAR